MSEEIIIQSLIKVASIYGKELAATVERVFRNETNHFKSENFADTLSPGMEAFGDKIPYGWNSLKDYWNTNASYRPVGIYDAVENSSALSNSRGIRHFIQFPTLEASMMSVAFVLNKRGGDGGSWFSKTDPARSKYNDYLSHIIPRFVNAAQL